MAKTIDKKKKSRIQFEMYRFSSFSLSKENKGDTSSFAPSVPPLFIPISGSIFFPFCHIKKQILTTQAAKPVYVKLCNIHCVN